MKVLVLTSDDWQGLYIDEILIDEGHHLGEGDNFMYMLLKSEKYGFTSKDVKSFYIDDIDVESTENIGNFPKNLSDLKGNYE